MIVACLEVWPHPAEDEEEGRLVHAVEALELLVG